MRSLVPQLFAIGKKQGHIWICWVVIGGPRYSGYKTLTVAPKLSVERVTKVVHSMGGRMGTHTSLRVPSWDSVVRPWYWSLHGHDSESYGGTHRVAPKAMAGLEAQMDAKFHMCYFSFS
jgi:hypothetical protein